MRVQVIKRFLIDDVEAARVTNSDVLDETTSIGSRVEVRTSVPDPLMLVRHLRAFADSIADDVAAGRVIP